MCLSYWSGRNQWGIWAGGILNTLSMFVFAVKSLGLWGWLLQKAPWCSMRRPGMRIPTVEQVSVSHVYPGVGVVICDTFQKQLYLIMLCVFFSFSLHVFPTTPVVTVSILNPTSHILGFFERDFVCYYHYNCLVAASHMCLARTPGLELPVTLFVCTWL